MVYSLDPALTSQQEGSLSSLCLINLIHSQLINLHLFMKVHVSHSWF